jgi:hypothetical protein
MDMPENQEDKPDNIPLDVSQMTEDAIKHVIEERANGNELRAMITKFKKMKIAFMQVGGKGNEGSLIYIALSKVKEETISHLRRQLYYIHL